MSYRTLLKSVSAGAVLALAAGLPAQAVVFHVGSGTIDGSLCIGNDCPASPSFGFDTLRLQENNLRMHFDDTSTTASFPQNDWRLYANDSANGGSSYFGIEDATAGRFVFRVFAGARSNALTIDSQGDLGLGTTTPATDIDIKIGDTPTVRLQQDGTSGFTPQTWDLAGNEASFFIRDATGGSTLPFRIRPTAPSSSVDIEGDGDIRIGHSSATTFQADIRQDDGTGVLKLATTTGGAIMQMDADNNGSFWNITAATGDSVINFNRNDGAGDVEMILDIDGNLTIAGEITTSGSCSIGCDRVFDETYEVPSIEEHAALMWSQGHLPNVGPTPESGSVNVSDKVLRMLNELEHAHIYIAELHERLEERTAYFNTEIAALKAVLAAQAR